MLKIHTLEKNLDSHTGLRTPRDVFKGVTEDFFVCQKSYGNTIRMNIFHTPKKNQLQVRVYSAVQIKKQFSTIKDHPI